MSCKISLEELSDENRNKINEELKIKIENTKYNIGAPPKYIYPYELEEDDVFLPFSYSYRELKLSRPVRNTFPVAKVNFEGELREEQKEVQKEALSILSRKGSVLISLYTGGGKTITSINLSTLIGFKTLVIVNKIVLMKQWEESILKFCPTASVQRVTTQSKKKDMDYYIMNAINVSKMGKKFFDDIGLVIVDECFPYYTPILTDNSYKYIGEIKKGDRVMSYNGKSRKFEIKDVVKTRAIKLNKCMVDIIFGDKNRVVRCTENHKILTVGGYKKAINLVSGDLVVSKTVKNINSDIISVLNKDQEQIIFGSILGNGEFKNIQNIKYVLNIYDNEENKEYCLWKANLLGIFDIEKTLDLKYKFTISDFYIPKISENDYNWIETDGYPTWLINNLDERALAIWYMDKGILTVDENNNYNTIILKTKIRKINIVEKLINRLKIFGIISYIKYNCKKYDIIIYKVQNFLKCVEKFIHKSMYYKLVGLIEKQYLYSDSLPSLQPLAFETAPWYGLSQVRNKRSQDLCHCI